jgi:acetoin utilization protein AcuB
MVVRDYMSTKLTTLAEDARLLDAALVIRRTGKRHVPIVNADGAPVGIVSDRDVARMAPSILAHMTPEEYNRVFEATPITLAMTKNPITVNSGSEIREAVALLYTKKIGALLVVDDGKLVGILTVNDMLGLLNELLAGPAKDEGQAAGATL